MTASALFHLAFPVHDLAAARSFYGDMLGCPEGRSSPEWTEVISGIAPGTPYAAAGSFLIRADIEKSGASHDH